MVIFHRKQQRDMPIHNFVRKSNHLNLTTTPFSNRNAMNTLKFNFLQNGYGKPSLFDFSGINHISKHFKDTLILRSVNFKNQYPKKGYPRSHRVGSSKYRQLYRNYYHDAHSNRDICGNTFWKSCFFVTLQALPSLWTGLFSF